MKPKYFINMSKILDKSLIKKTNTFNFAKAKGNNKRINSNRPKYTINLNSSDYILISILELLHRVKGITPPWGKFYAINKPAFIGFDEKFTERLFIFCNYLYEKMMVNEDIKLSQAQLYTIFDILVFSNMLHNRLKKSKTNLVKYLPMIKSYLFLTLKMKDLRDDSFTIEALNFRSLKNLKIIY